LEDMTALVLGPTFWGRRVCSIIVAVSSRRLWMKLAMAGLITAGDAGVLSILEPTMMVGRNHIVLIFTFDNGNPTA
jgi:hypothetical protein